jgi:tetratricopeptide (TPR) repeat protein
VTVAKGCDSEGGTPVTLRASPVSWSRSFGRSADREQLRRRVLAFAGIWFLLAGFLWALGLGVVLLLSLALLLIGAVLAGGLWLQRRYHVERAFRAGAASIEQASREGKTRLDGLGLRRRLHRSANGVSRRAHRSANGVSRRAHAFLENHRRKPAADDRGGRAHRLNELGAQLRREGDYELAVEQRAALAIVRELGDRRAEALTLNNLALALVHTGGGVPVAVEHFEQSLFLLRELGDEELEGQVIANLGFVRRRQGRDEDAESLLHAALEKLPPESSAYRQVEEQLRRAS